MTDEEFWQLMSHAKSVLTDPTSILGLIVALMGNALAWAQSLDIGAIATAITLVTTAVVGAVVMAYGQIAKARLNALRDYETAFRESLQKQVVDLTEDLKDEARRHETTRRELNHVMQDRDAIREELADNRAERARLSQEISDVRHDLANYKSIEVTRAKVLELKAERAVEHADAVTAKVDRKVERTRAELGLSESGTDHDIVRPIEPKAGDTGEFEAVKG
jgi:septal ring factor EnvC (AmiA/AmiB activator)